MGRRVPRLVVGCGLLSTVSPQTTILVWAVLSNPGLKLSGPDSGSAFYYIRESRWDYPPKSRAEAQHSFLHDANSILGWYPDQPADF